MENENSIVVHGELYHWGIKGMKWGIRRYQTKDGSLTPAGRKRYNQDMEKIKAETKRLKNQQRTDAKLAKLEEAKKNLKDLKRGKDKTSSEIDEIEDIEAKKAKILESRSPKAIYDNANLFTTNELMAAKMRLELERNIKNLEPPTVDKGKEFTDKFSKNANNISSVVDSGAKAYNSIAKIYNSMIGNKNGATLPMINDSTSSKLDKFKEQTEWIKAKNERKKADKEADDKKSDLDLLKEETARIDAENKNREAKRASRKHDESDRKESQKAAEDAEKQAKEKAKRDAEQEQYEAYNRKYTDEYSESSGSYRNNSRERSNVNPNESREVSIYNSPLTSLSTESVSRGRSFAENSYDNWDDYVDVTNDPTYPGNKNVSSSTISIGQRTIAGLLSAPKEDDD